MTTKKRICTVIIVLVIVCAVCVGGFFVWKKTGQGRLKKLTEGICAEGIVA